MWWWSQRIHVSRLIGIICFCFVAGVAAALLLKITFWVGLIGLGTCIGACIISRYWCIPVVILAGVSAGLGFGSAHLEYRTLYDPYIGKIVTVRGVFKEDPSFKAGSASLQLKSVVIDGTALPGTVFASVRGVQNIKRSDTIEGLINVKEGFGNFVVALTFISVDHYERASGADYGRELRDWFADTVRRSIPEPAASLGIGFLTGQKSALPADLADNLKIAGLTHIVVASGYNLTILVQLARRLFVRISKYVSAVMAGCMIAGFVCITGLSPSMTRAGLVSGLSLYSWYYGRAFHPFILLPVAAAITVLFDPSFVWGDVGWQLSFSAFAGVMIVGPLLHHYFFGKSEASMLRQIAGETIAAHLVTIPIIALNFGVISNYAIIANMLVVPLVPFVMLLTFLCGITWLIFAPLASFLAVPTSWLLQYMLNVANTVAELPGAQWSFEVSGWVWAVYGLILIGSCAWMWRVSGYDFSPTRTFT